jgi:hypothetical protein
VVGAFSCDPIESAHCIFQSGESFVGSHDYGS